MVYGYARSNRSYTEKKIETILLLLLLFGRCSLCGVCGKEVKRVLDDDNGYRRKATAA